jgi:hypothetical protein
VLTYVLTLSTLRAQRLLLPWVTSTVSQPQRLLYYTPQWSKDFNGLTGVASRLGLRIRPAAQDWVRGFLDRYVDGEPLHRLIRPDGYAMFPPFKRLDPPHSEFVELRTEDTRTFGFFTRGGAYIADRIVLTGTLKKPDRSADRAAYAAVVEDMKQRWVDRLDPAEIESSSDVANIY